MNADPGGVYGPETVELLESVLEDAWACLPPEQQMGVSKSQLAERILRAAARGEPGPGSIARSRASRGCSTSPHGELILATDVSVISCPCCVQKTGQSIPRCRIQRT